MRDTAAGAVSRGRQGGGRARRPPRPPSPGTSGAEVRDELVKVLGQAKGARAADRVREARAPSNGSTSTRPGGCWARSPSRPPACPACASSTGSRCTDSGGGRTPCRELEAFRTLTRSSEQHPVLADSYRALRQWQHVDELWEELREESLSADLVAEGRIVVAGSLADRSRLPEAIALLDERPPPRGRVQVHHLREAYVLADLQERAGDVARRASCSGGSPPRSPTSPTPPSAPPTWADSLGLLGALGRRCRIAVAIDNAARGCLHRVWADADAWRQRGAGGAVPAPNGSPAAQPSVVTGPR